MPLAAIGIFVMVLGVMATLNLGQAVHQKIKLQNTADAAAYTLAAMEARTFNYIAFLNRAQIAHYNTAMVVQSYLTWVGFQVALFGTAVDLVITLKNAVTVGTRFPYPANLPYNAIIGLITSLAQFLEQWRNNVVTPVYKLGEKLGHQIVEAMTIFNKDVMWQSQFARAALLNVHLLTGMQNYIEKHDPDISFTNGQSVVLNLFVNMALNSIEYYQTFDNASGLNPFVYGIAQDIKRVFPGFEGDFSKRKDEPAKDAYKIMAELCHASRSPQFVSNRSGPAMGMAILANIMGSKQGQTKFTSSGKMDGGEIPPIGNEKNYEEGAYLSSDDFLQSGTGLGTIGLATVVYTGNKKLGDAIAAYETDGKHYKYTKPSSTSEARISPGGSETIALPPPTMTAQWSSPTENHAPWPGFAPYFMFKAKGDRTADFNQPSTWIFLNKSHKDFQTTDSGSHGSGRAPWLSKFSWRNGAQFVELDSTIGGKRNSYMFEGLNVLSRGMAYYHRPKNWKEQPNFFNPYWRARLAPVGQKLQNFWDRWVTQKITTSSDSAVVKGMVNFLRNAQMDMMTSFITALVTH